MHWICRFYILYFLAVAFINYYVYGYEEAQTEKTESSSSGFVASVLQEKTETYHWPTSLDSKRFSEASLKRQSVAEFDLFNHVSVPIRGVIPLALPVLTPQQENTRALSTVQTALDNRTEARDTTCLPVAGRDRTAVARLGIAPHRAHESQEQKSACKDEQRKRQRETAGHEAVQWSRYATFPFPYSIAFSALADIRSYEYQPASEITCQLCLFQQQCFQCGTSSGKRPVACGQKTISRYQQGSGRCERGCGERRSKQFSTNWIRPPQSFISDQQGYQAIEPIEGSEKQTQRTVAEAPQGFDCCLGKSNESLQRATEAIHRSNQQGEVRVVNCKKGLAESQQTGRIADQHEGRNSPGCARYGRGHRRDRGDRSSTCPSSARLPETGGCSRQSHRYSGCDGLRRRGGRAQVQKATLARAISTSFLWWCNGSTGWQCGGQQDVSQGDEAGCLRNLLHAPFGRCGEAGITVEAYADDFMPQCAACSFPPLDSTIMNLILCHSIRWEDNFMPTFVSRKRALDLQYEIANNLLLEGNLPTEQKPFPSWPIFGSILKQPTPRNVNQEDHLSDRMRKKVSFQDPVDLRIESEGSDAFQSLQLEHGTLINWIDKPCALQSWGEQPQQTQRTDADPTPGYQDMLISSKVFAQCSAIHERETDRLTDEHDMIPQRIASLSAAPPTGQQRRAGPFPLPGFVEDIFGLPNILALPPNFIFEHGLTIRTWYIHHDHFPRWVVPRFVELDHDVTRWQHEIVTSWRDMIIPHENIHFYTVMPDPDRSFVNRQIAADVIIAQDSEDDRYAGLLTVHHLNTHGSIRAFAVALSLPAEVSGIDLANAADILHLCRTQQCRFTFGWQRIPFTMAPSHYMMDGHGFAAHILPTSPVEAGSQGHSTAQGSATGADNRDTSPALNNDRPESLDFEQDQDSQHLSDTSIPGSTSQFEDWQGLHIYRLDRTIVHCFLRWGSYNAILQQVVHFLQEHLRNIVGIHHVHVALTGQHEAEESVILQYVSDIPPGSTEKLVIVDSEIRHNFMPPGLPRAPDISRKVYKILPHVTREYLLRLVRLANYCFLQAERCLVFINNEIWPEQDRTIKHARHGDFFRIVASSPLDTSVSTEIALNFAMQIDDDEASHAVACPVGTRNRHSLALFQTSSAISQPAVEAVGSRSRKASYTSHAGDRMDPTTHTLDLRIPGNRIDRPDSLSEAPKWLRMLKNEFDLKGFVECTEEGQVAYIDTWYVSHAYAPRCSVSRPVRLTDEPSKWQDIILSAWDDLRDPHAPSTLHIVNPSPPATQMESTLLHVIIEQHCQVLTHAAGIISVIRIDRHHAALTHVAISIARLTQIRNIAWHVQLQDLCVLRQCKVFRGREPLPVDGIEDLDSGFGLVFLVPPPSGFGEPIDSYHALLLWNQATAAHMNVSDPDLIDSDEDGGFMQTTLLKRRLDVQSNETGQAVTCKTGEPDNHNEIPVSFPNGELPVRPRPRHDGQIAWISDLWEIFQTQGEWNVWDEQSFVTVSTWFIHHERHAVCRRPRQLRLVGAPITWIPDLRARWLDLMDMRQPFSIHIVHPRPPQFRTANTACHVLLEQRASVNSAAIVLTALFEGPSHDGISQGAYSTARQVNRQSLINTLEIAPNCIGRHCSVTREHETFHDDVWFEVSSGSSVRVHVRSPAISITDDEPEGLHFEDLTLMQTGTRVQLTLYWTSSVSSCTDGKLPRPANTLPVQSLCTGFQPKYSACFFAARALARFTQSMGSHSICLGRRDQRSGIPHLGCPAWDWYSAMFTSKACRSL